MKILYVICTLGRDTIYETNNDVLSDYDYNQYININIIDQSIIR